MITRNRLALAAVLAVISASPVLAATVHHRAPVSRGVPGVRASAQPRSGSTNRDSSYYSSREYLESQGASEGFHGGN
jgi:hypothetical protein